MKLFKKTGDGGGAVSAVQLRASDRHPFRTLDGYVPLRSCETELYRSIREAVPVVDAAIVKLIRLTGGVSAQCGDKRAETELNDFLRHVSIGRGQRGLDAFLACYLDSMFTYGRAVGEIVLSGRRDIAALLCGRVSDIEIREGDTPLDFKICMWSGHGEPVPLPHQELLLFTPLNPEAENPYGVSLLRSMPFLTGVLLKIYEAIGQNWERAGNVRFAVVYKPQGDALDRVCAKERSEQIASEWAAAMQPSKSGGVRDFVAVGDVDVKVIGADGQILDSETPVRQIVEQLVARTGIPPFMLGLNWSSTERMSSQQADILTSEVTAVRRSLEPMIERICSLWLGLHGYDRAARVCWTDINLQDETEEARAELYRAQAEKLRTEIKGEVKN